MSNTKLVTVEKSNSNIVDESYIDNLDNIIGGDLFSNLEIELKNDVLFKILKDSDRKNDIVTDNMKELLVDGKLYSTPDTSKMLDVPVSTLRGWILELQQYVEPIIQGKRFIKLNAKSIYKLRMIQILRDHNEYPVANLRKLTLGVEIVAEDSEKDIKSLNEKVEELISNQEKTNFKMEQMANGMKVLMGLIDLDAFEMDGTILLNREKVIPLLESDSQIFDKVDKRVENSLEHFKDVISDDVHEKLEEAKEDTNKKIAETIETQIQEIEIKYKTFTKEQIKEFSDKMMKKSLWERIFGVRSKRS